METMKFDMFNNSLSIEDAVLKLVRDSERLAIARQYVSETKYPDKDILVAILGKAEENETAKKENEEL